MPLLQVRRAQYTAGETQILRGMNLTVEQGTVHAVVGPNGAGKTTLAFSIMGLPAYRLDAGQVLFDGEDITNASLPERARMGMSLAWQEPARFEGITVREFLAVGAAAEDESRLRAALESVALDPDDYLDRVVDTSLSGGERKRIEVASIVVMEPRLMILDEPDSGIDVEALEAIFDLLDTRSNHSSVLLVTHSEQVLDHADKATLMCCGKNVKEGPIDQIEEYFSRECIPCDIHNPDLVEGENAN
jgi:Fe-S cluster assembly ATP-binding protein